MITSGEEFLSEEALTNIAYYDIPFPLKRIIVYNDNKTWITITVNYEKIEQQLQTFNSNKHDNNI